MVSSWYWRFVSARTDTRAPDLRRWVILNFFIFDSMGRANNGIHKTDLKPRGARWNLILTVSKWFYSIQSRHSETSRIPWYPADIEGPGAQGCAIVGDDHPKPYNTFFFSRSRLQDCRNHLAIAWIRFSSTRRRTFKKSGQKKSCRKNIEIKKNQKK